METRHKNILYNLLFLTGCGAILLFLLYAPPETTKPLPHDQNHQPFMTMKKKEAEKSCETCHAATGEAPLPANHPPKYRCLFCHKRK